MFPQEIRKGPLPWEVPLAKPLPEAAVCIGCGRNRHEILDQDGHSDFRSLAVVFGLAICWRCTRSEDHNWNEEFRAACAVLWKTKREPLECGDPSRRFETDVEAG